MTVTNDGATILKAIGVDNPAAKVLVGEWSRRRHRSVRSSVRPSDQICVFRSVEGSGRRGWRRHHLRHRARRRAAAGKTPPLWSGPRLRPLSHATCLFPQEAELLVSRKIHPQTIISGWRKATQAARDALREAAVDHR